MTQSAIPAQELVKRLCEDRKINGTSPFNDPKKFSELRRVVDQLPIIRELGNKNLHGWELDLDADHADPSQLDQGVTDLLSDIKRSKTQSVYANRYGQAVINAGLARGWIRYAGQMRYLAFTSQGRRYLGLEDAA